MSEDAAADLVLAAAAALKRLDAVRKLPALVAGPRHTVRAIAGALAALAPGERAADGPIYALRERLRELVAAADDLDKLGDAVEARARAGLFACVAAVPEADEVRRIGDRLAAVDEALSRCIDDVVRVARQRGSAGSATASTAAAAAVAAVTSVGGVGSGVANEGATSKAEDARSFWATNFRQAREADLDELCEALHAEAVEAGFQSDDLETAMRTCRAALGGDGCGKEAISALRFAEVFGDAPVLETLSRIGRKGAAATVLVSVPTFVLSPTHAPDRDVEPCSVMMRADASLADLRRELKRAAAARDAEDEAEEGGGGARRGARIAPGGSVSEFDVFISYRRLGGADFAQLLKVQLMVLGYSVFLDTDNLGTGNFEAELVTHLKGARNVVLLWTRSCMDRFLDGNDPGESDFVRLEYRTSLELGKHIVPVYKEDFEFPAASRLPPACRGVLGINAVKWVADYREASFRKLVGALKAPLSSGGDPDHDFIRNGAFDFFLDGGAARVRRTQERDMVGRDIFSRCCIVRSTASQATTATYCTPAPPAPAPMLALPAPVPASTVNASSDPDGIATDPDGTAPDAVTRILELAAVHRAAGLSLEAVLADSAMLHGLRTEALRLRIDEAAIAFLVQLAQLRATNAGAAPARTQLVKGSARALSDRFFAEGSALELPLPAETQATVRTALASALADEGPASAERVLAALDGPAQLLARLVEPALRSLAAKLAAPEKVLADPRAAAVAHADGKQRTRVVVVGAGFVGSQTAHWLDLDERFAVTLVNARAFYEDVTQQPASSVSPGTSLSDMSAAWPRSVLPLDKIVTRGAIVIGEVEALSRTHIEVGPSRTVVPFDVLVLAMGSHYSSTIKTLDPSLAFRHRQMQQEQKMNAEARSILIIGGGLVGCELTGELASTFPGKPITLLQARDRLLPRIPRAHEIVAPYLQSLGVRIKLNQRVKSFDEAGVVLEDGTRVEAGRVIRCTGCAPNTSPLRSAGSDPAFAAALDPKGFINVDANLRVVGFDNVFAGGDLLADHPRNFPHTGATTSGERTGAAAHIHGVLIADNIMRGRVEPPRPLARCDFRRAPDSTHFISLGKTRGLGVLGSVYSSQLTSLVVRGIFRVAFGINLDFGPASNFASGSGIVLAACITPLKLLTTKILIGEVSVDTKFSALAPLTNPAYIVPEKASIYAASEAADLGMPDEAMTASEAAELAAEHERAAEAEVSRMAEAARREAHAALDASAAGAAAAPTEAPAPTGEAEEREFLSAQPAAFAFLRSKGAISRAGAKVVGVCPLAVADSELAAFAPDLVMRLVALGYIEE